jgi:hypothetical protein
MSDPQKTAISIKAFCQSNGISHSRAYVEIREGRLKVRKCGRRSLILVSEAEAWFSRLKPFFNPTNPQEDEVD